MRLNINIIPKLLHFKKPAGTSRGSYTTRKVWYLLVQDTETGKSGIGECAPLPDLSCDAIPNYESILKQFTEEFMRSGHINFDRLSPYPSIRFGFETALAHLKAGSIRFYNTPFTRGEEGIPINGLIWMGNFDEMFSRIEQKLQAGFHCIKIKIGAIQFEKEIELIRHIRSHFSPQQIQLRLDANGAFSPSEAAKKLERLSAFSIHSIEQPIRAGQREAMRQLCTHSPIPIALDEELIGVNTLEEKINLLHTIAPQYIILKPSLHGGIAGAEEWINCAKEMGINYWITSALESNIGLNAITQWCSTLPHSLPQGLGTGMLFTDNIDFPLKIKGDALWFSNNYPQPKFFDFLSNDENNQ